MSAGESTAARVKASLDTRPRGTVIQVDDSSGRRFWLEAEGGAFNDYILHRGQPPQGLEGRASNRGLYRRFWSTQRLGQWVADGLCEIELVSITANRNLK